MTCFLSLTSLLLLPGLLQAQHLEDLQVQNLQVEHRSDRLLEDRIGFANFTSGLLPLFPVSSSDYSLFALAMAGVVSGLLLAYSIMSDSFTLLSNARSAASRSWGEQEQGMRVLQGLQE